MADTFVDRIAQAISDPGSITVRKLDGDSQPEETLARWQTRAVLTVVSEHRWAPDAEPIGTSRPIAAALLLAFYGFVLLGAGLWLGAVWL